MAPYSSTKYALESIGDGFRMELKKWNIDVCIIEPGSIQTEFSNTFEHTLESLEKQISTSNYKCGDEVLQSYIKSMNEFKTPKYKRGHVSLVTQVVTSGFLDSSPLSRYFVGYDSIAIWIMEKLPEIWTDKIFGKNYL
jgi:short-subunit dehydrogenase